MRDDSKRWRLGSGVPKAKRTDNRSLTREENVHSLLTRVSN